MLVSQYAVQVINSKALKSNTKIGYIRAFKRLGIWDMEISSITAALIMEKVKALRSQPTKNTTLIAVKSIFKEVNDCSLLKVKRPMFGKVYDLPSQEALEWAINRSRFRLQYLFMMYAGLRLSEACAMTIKKLQGHEGYYWLLVDEGLDLEGKEYSDAKTVGKVMIPDWLALEMKNAKPSDWFPKNGKPAWVSAYLRRTAVTKEWKKISNNKPITPHMLRHWFATDMIKRGVNPEVARRQMRHSSPLTTLMVYTQVKSDEIKESMPTRPKPVVEDAPLAKIIRMPNTR